MAANLFWVGKCDLACYQEPELAQNRGQEGGVAEVIQPAVPHVRRKGSGIQEGEKAELLRRVEEGEKAVEWMQRRGEADVSRLQAAMKEQERGFGRVRGRLLMSPQGAVRKKCLCELEVWCFVFMLCASCFMLCALCFMLYPRVNRGPKRDSSIGGDGSGRVCNWRPRMGSPAIICVSGECPSS